MDTTDTRVPPTTALDVASIRRRFPILRQTVYGHPLVYLDNAATSQKPQAVLDRLEAYYQAENSNVHRGVHKLSRGATDAYEAARVRTASFINAATDREVVYTRGTTESINLVASTFGRMQVGPGDVVLVTTMEHHSNVVPWQMLCEERKAELAVIPISDTGEIVYEAFERLLDARVRMLALSHVSNTLGTVNPVKRMIRDAHERGIAVLVDGAQAVPHMKVDVQDLDCDFYCFSAHKMFGPTGIGVLYGKAEHLERMPPAQGGGGMIETVSFEKTTWTTPPEKFEAGTPNVAGTLGLETAIAFIEDVGQDRVGAHEHGLIDHATARLLEIDGVRLIGTASEKVSVLSFLIDPIHPYDAGVILDRLGIAVRTGHHCTQPLMQRFGIPGTIRASFALYNTLQEVDTLVEGVRKVKAMLG